MQTAQRTLPRALRAAATRQPERDALVDGQVRLSYAALHDEVRTTARALISLGVGLGDRVCVWAPNSWQWAVSALATTYIGAVLVPLNSRYTGHEAADIVRRTRARAVVLADGFLRRDLYEELRAASADDTPPTRTADSSGRHPLPGLPGMLAVIRIPHSTAAATRRSGVVDFAALPEIARATEPHRVEALADAVSPDDTADILFTSGTTGRSKGACSAHRQTISTAEIWGRMGALNPTDRYLVVNPFFHSFGYKAGILVCLLSGAVILPQAVFDRTETLRLIEQEKISVLAGAPTIHQSLLDSPDREGHDLGSLRLGVTGAALIPVTLIERMRAELGFDVVLTAYGLTEAVVATMCRPGDPAHLVANTVGRAVPGFELRIARPGGNDPLPAGTEGEILLRGENVMTGYLDDPLATAEVVDEQGWLHTGDIGRVDEQGYLKITDRLKDMFIVGGFNVYPAEIEQVLAQLDGVTESAVIGVPDERLGEVGKVFVVRAGGSAVTEQAVLAHCEERLANFKIPRQVVFVDELPRNPSGKILKRDLREPAPNAPQRKEFR